jgi:DNA-binding NarL/FixJ family response regulator
MLGHNPVSHDALPGVADAAAPRILVADDHPPTRAGVRAALGRAGMEVCAEAATAPGAIDAAVRERPDVCLLDVHMPGGGTSAASAITLRVPGTVVIMLTASDADEDLFESLRRGAVGYILKDIDPAELPLAIRATLSGEGYLPGRLAARLMREFHDRPGQAVPVVQGPGHRLLTAREQEVLTLLAEGAGTAAIAKRLFLSPVTVRRHISAILAKLGVGSREEAVELARRGVEPVDGGAGSPRAGARG